MDEKRRELATNRLLEVIRQEGAEKTKPKGAVEKPPERESPPQVAPSQAPPGRPERPVVKQQGEPKSRSELLDRLISEPKAKISSKTQTGDESREPAVEPEPEPLTPPMVDYEEPPVGFFQKIKAKLPELKAKPRGAGGKTVKRKIGGKRIIAVDIGRSSVKVIEVLKTADSVQLVDAEVRQIPMSLRDNKTSLKVLHTKILRELLPVHRIKSAHVHISLSDRNVQYKKIGLPAVPAKERINAIKFQIKKELPFPLDVCEISYRGWNPKINQRQDVEVLAIDNRIVDNNVEILDEIKVLPTQITAVPASMRYLVKGYSGVAVDQGAVAVVDIGASKTTITILEGDKLILCRTITTGGDEFTAVLHGFDPGTGESELNDAQAEKYKIDHGLPPETENMRVHIQMRPVIERIQTEISRSVDFYRRERTGGDLQKLILIGGGALMKRLPEFLNQNLGIEIELGHPSARVIVPSKNGDGDEETAFPPGPVLMPALALALDTGDELNLLPKKIQSEIQMIQLRRVIPPAALAVMILIISVYTIALNQLKDVKHKAESLESSLSSLSEQRNAFSTAKAQFDRLVRELATRENDFSSIRIGNPEIPTYLRALTFLVPRNIYLERLKTGFISEEEQKAAEVNPEQGAPNIGTLGQTNLDSAQFGLVSVDQILANLKGVPAATGEALLPPKVKRLILGRIVELEGNVYRLGSLTDVQLVDFVFALENSGYFREVAVDSVASLDDGNIWFRILCGI